MIAEAFRKNINQVINQDSNVDCDVHEQTAPGPIPPYGEERAAIGRGPCFEKPMTPLGFEQDAILEAKRQYEEKRQAEIQNSFYSAMLLLSNWLNVFDDKPLHSVSLLELKVYEVTKQFMQEKGSL